MKPFSVFPALFLFLTFGGPLFAAPEPAATAAPTPAVPAVSPETLKLLVGRYATGDAGAGTISLRDGKTLVATLADGTTYELVPKGITFEIKGLDATSEFRRNAAGVYNEVVTSVGGQTFTATRVEETEKAAAPAPLTREVLKSMTGRYTTPGDLVVTVSLRGEDGLTATLSDGTSYDLTPTQGTIFSIKGIEGTAEFRRKVDGAYSELVGALSSGTYTATRIP